tara:strand:- start:12528 stop:13835 length:1308 start_codon:yes stop_codon:yes gene_type:complete
MKDIVCPSCGKTFRIDPSSFDELLSQIKNEEFTKQISERLKLAEEEKKREIELIKKDFELEIVNNQKEMEKNIIELESKLSSVDKDKENEINFLRNESQNTINKLNIKIKQLSYDMLNQAEMLKLSKEKEIINAVSKLEEDKTNLRISFEKLKQEKSDSEKALELSYQEKIKERDLKISNLRDMQLKLSTKMQGETLEKHCENEFNKIRSTGFQTSIFEKDNDSKSGSKGDYIFKEFDNQNNEIISIMFEMKNESSNSINKKKNEDFFKELDKDRKEKSCEYAVLVSLLEQESDLYNSGIVDVSHRYPKMYVIRPQFFIPIISLLRNAAIKSLKYKHELELERSKKVDINNFENTLNQFKNAVGNNVRLASDRFKDAIIGIEKTIKTLEKTKEALLLSEQHLQRANTKSQDLTVKKLTYNNPTMKKEFENLNKDN